VKPILALTLLPVLACVAAGCGATKKIVVKADTNSLKTMISRDYVSANTLAGTTITVNGSSAVIPNVKAGTRIKCKKWGGPGVKVPQRGAEADASESKATVNGTTSSTQDMQLRHQEDGWVTVLCTSSQ
jgi:ABC-type phosphate transport system substrate-binding protein